MTQEMLDKTPFVKPLDNITTHGGSLELIIRGFEVELSNFEGTVFTSEKEAKQAYEASYIKVFTQNSGYA